MKPRHGRPIHKCKQCGAEVHDLIKHMAVKHNDEQSQRMLKELEKL